MYINTTILMRPLKNFLPMLPVIVLAACNGKAQPDAGTENPHSRKFNDYWYAGKAELTSYHLTQSRYGDLHDGSAVLIFVTEDFSREKQVKLDDPYENADDAVKVMKLNFTKNFTTGIYPYSMMFSCFTPVDTDNNPRSVKLTTSSQEWCGHTYLQLNKMKNDYKLSGYSYFESEGDQQQSLKLSVLEDELWNIIRLNPDKLPVGQINIIPGSFASRLTHHQLQNTRAVAGLNNNKNAEFGGEGVMEYTVAYKNPERTIKIYFESAFPYRITGWEDSYRGAGGKLLTTKAVKNESMLLDYWAKNKPEHETYRDALGLE